MKSILFFIGFVVATLAMFLSCDREQRPSSPGYVVKDYDPRLTTAAKKAAPIIEALDRYMDEHKSAPADAHSLTSYLPSDIHVSGSRVGFQMISEWYYFPTELGYEISISVGQETSLMYEVVSKKGQWFFRPGDGTPNKFIVLTVESGNDK